MANERVERRLAAILAADVAGYSRLMGVDEVGTLNGLKAIRRELADPAIAAHHGRVVKTTGDGILIEFASVVDAVACAVAIQGGMVVRNERVPEDKRIVFRIGINIGDIIIDEGDIHGDGVNVAARLEGLAQPGGICISGAAHDQVRGKLDVAFEDMGEQTLKNIARPVRAYLVSVGPSPPSEPVAPEGEPAFPLPDKPLAVVRPIENGRDRRHSPALSSDALAMVAAAARDNGYIIFRALGRGGFAIAAGRARFGENGNKREIERLRAALDELLELSLVRDLNRDGLYELTDAGYRVADSSSVAVPDEGPLRLAVGEAGGFFETKRAGSLYTHKRILKVRISNSVRSSSLTGCKIYVMDILPHERDGPWLLKEGFSLAAGDHEFVPLASYTEPDNIDISPYGDTFMEILVTKNQPLPPSNVPHILTIRATTLDGPFCEIKCRLWVDESGRLRIEAVPDTGG